MTEPCRNRDRAAPSQGESAEAIVRTVADLRGAVAGKFERKDA